MRLTYREAMGRWSASGFVDNVLDKTYIRHSDMENRQTGCGARLRWVCLRRRNMRRAAARSPCP